MRHIFTTSRVGNLLTSLIIMTLLFGLRAGAQPPTPISYGDCVQGTIGERNEVDRYVLVSSGNEIVNIRLAANWRYYPQVEIYTPGAVLLRRAAGQYSVLIDTLRLVEPGSYTILVLDDNGQETGEYSLCVQRTAMPMGAVSLAYGDTRTGSLNWKAQMKPFTFSAEAGDVITARVAGNWRYYPQLDVYDPAGNLIRRSAGQYSTRLNALVLPASGTYSVMIMDDNGQETGPFGMHIQRLTSPGQATRLVNGQTVQDSLTLPAGIKAYTFSGRTAERVRISIAADWRYYPQIELYGPGGNLLTSAIGQYSALIDGFILTESGSHTILAMDDNGQETGHFSLTLVQIPSTDVHEYGSAVPLQYSLAQNYPNPFNPATTIRFGVPRESAVKLDVYNLIGQRVATLVDGVVSAGFHSCSFDGSGLSSGVYVYRLTAGEFTTSKTLVLLK